MRGGGWSKVVAFGGSCFEISHDTMKSQFMNTAGRHCKVGALVDGKSYIRAGRVRQVVQHPNNGTIVPRMLSRRPCQVGSKDGGSWSGMFGRLVLQTASRNNFLNEAGLNKFQMSVIIAADVYS